MRQNYLIKVFTAGLICFASLYALQKLRPGPQEPAPHVFINETQDHRFDESVQVSILASQRRTGVQNAVVITNRFAGTDLQKVAAAVFADLRLGRENHGRAILYLYSPEEKSLKIEVGYALEGLLPDSKVHALEMAAKTFIYTDRYQDFWAELINTLNIEIQQQERGADEPAEKFDFSKMRFVSGGGGVFSNRYDVSLKQLEDESKKIKNPADSPYQPSNDLQGTLKNYFESLRQGLGDESLPLLSWESRIYRQLTPMTTYQLFRNWDMYSKAGVERIFELGRLAFVFFKAEHPVLPIILQKENGLWTVNEPLSWALFHRFEDSLRVFLKYPIEAPDQEFENYLTTQLAQPLYPQPTVTLGRWPQKSIQSSYFSVFWLERVDFEFQKSKWSQLSDADLWVASDVMTHLGRYSEQLKILRELQRRQPKNAILARNLKFYEEVYQFTGPQWRLAF